MSVPTTTNTTRPGSTTKPKSLEDTVKALLKPAVQKDGETARRRSEKQRLRTVLEQTQAKCIWMGESNQAAMTCDKPCFTGGIFCRKHHQQALDCHTMGSDMEAAYPDWKPIDLPADDQGVKQTRPLAEFIKTPEELDALYVNTLNCA